MSDLDRKLSGESLRANAVAETNGLATYLLGYADAVKVNGGQETAARLRQAAKWLSKLSSNICGQGYVGCRGGEKCTSDHK